ncbi:MAG: hypothetical protein ABL880_02990 [Methylotenera sp.]
MNGEFGFLINPLKGEFLGISITPLPDHTNRLEAIQKDSNRDGFYYPPQIATYNVDLKTNKRKNKVARSERPASLFFLPSSHQITIQNPICKDGEKGTDEALIVFLLAYIHGTRLMPSQWKFDGRVPIKSVNNIYITGSTTLHFLEHVYTWWKALSENQRIKFVNILYVFNRARSLEWEWDAFLHQYIVFDALYDLHHEFNPPSQRPKLKERFNILCEKYSVFNEDLVNRIYSTRNDLFHEAMWVGSTIGFGSPDKEAYQLPYHLARLNAQLICGITGYKNQYTRLPWWVMGTLEFDKMS